MEYGRRTKVSSVDSPDIRRSAVAASSFHNGVGQTLQHNAAASLETQQTSFEEARHRALAQNDTQQMAFEKARVRALVRNEQAARLESLQEQEISAAPAQVPATGLND